MRRSAIPCSFFCVEGIRPCPKFHILHLSLQFLLFANLMTPLSNPSNASFMQTSLAFLSLQLQIQPSPIKENITFLHLYRPMDIETRTYINTNIWREVT